MERFLDMKVWFKEKKSLARELTEREFKEQNLIFP